MSFINWLRGVKAKVDIEPIADGNVILQDNGDGTADLFVDKGNQRLHVTDSAKTTGHIIWNAIKTALTPQRTKLWFADSKVTDDSTEQATKVEVVQLIDDESELTNAPDGVYQGDYEDAPEGVLDASMVAYGDGSVEDALDGLIVENKKVWANLTLAANSSTAVQTSDISKSGYTPIGIVGYSFDGSYGNCLSYSKLTVSGNTLTYLVANNGNSSATSVNCVVQIFYKKAKQ